MQALKRRKKPGQSKYVPAFATGATNGRVLKQAIFWLLALVFLIVFLFIFSSIMLPFVAGITLAYFLNPIVEKMSKLGVSRLWSTVMITMLILLVFVVALTLLIPIITSQIEQFISNGLPVYIARIQQFLASHSADWITNFLPTGSSDIQANIQALLGQSSDVIKSVLNSLMSSGRSIVNIFSLLVVAPVVAFYLLLDWDSMVASIDSWIPRDHLATVRGIFYEMDRAVAGFIRGQGTVCLILGVYYATGLSLVGLNFGLSIGIFVGVVSFIPYIGSMTGFLLSVGVAWVQFYPDNWAWVIVVMCIFFFGQFVEGYVLQPKLVGSSVGLHPVWLMFALFAFSSLFGFTGTLIAVPAAAAVGVLVRFALHTYLASPLYAQDKAERAQ